MHDGVRHLQEVAIQLGMLNTPVSASTVTDLPSEAQEREDHGDGSGWFAVEGAVGRVRVVIRS